LSLHIPFWEHVGMKEMVALPGEGYAEVRLDVTPEVLNPHGMVHGGALATLVDGSIGAAVRTVHDSSRMSSTIELKINYLRPAKGSWLLAKASLYHHGSRTAVGKSEIYDENGNLVAVGTATFMILPKREQ